MIHVFAVSRRFGVVFNVLLVMTLLWIIPHLRVHRTHVKNHFNVSEKTLLYDSNNLDIPKKMHVENFVSESSFQTITSESFIKEPQFHASLNHPWKTMTFYTGSIVSRKQHKVYLLNAVYDERYSPPVVRLDSVDSLRLDGLVKTFKCRFWSTIDASVEAHSVVARVKHRVIPVQREPISQIHYRPNVYLCNVSDVSRYKFMSLAYIEPAHPDNNAESDRIEILQPEKPSVFAHEFGVCVSSSFGTLRNNNVTWMTEWFEFHKLLGVTEIHIYNVTLRAEPQMQRLLE